MARRLLVVSFHYPPASGVAARRVGSLVRELRALGWETSVVAGPAADATDDVVRLASRPWTPRIQGADWAAAARGPVLARAGAADVALLSGGPFAPFLLGPALRRRGVPYVLDFRDPWSWEPRFERFRPGARRAGGRMLERAAERRALAAAAAVVTVAPEIGDEYERLYPWLQGRVHVVRHGFDPCDFASAQPDSEPGDPVLLHAGTMLAGDRTPELILDAARRVRAAGRPLRVVLLGAFSPELLGFVEEPLREGWLELREPVPHGEAIAKMRTASVLWLQPGTERFLVTGKIYEYLAARRPIVAAVRSDASAAAVLRGTGAGLVVPPEADAAARALVAALDGKVPVAGDAALAALEQPSIVRRLSDVLEAVAR